MQLGSGIEPGGYSLLNRTIPFLSTITIALNGAPIFLFKRPYEFVISPCGQKSASSGYLTPPRELDHARCEC